MKQIIALILLFLFLIKPIPAIAMENYNYFVLKEEESNKLIKKLNNIDKQIDNLHKELTELVKYLKQREKEELEKQIIQDFITKYIGNYRNNNEAKTISFSIIKWTKYINNSNQKIKIDPLLIVSIAKLESCFNNSLVCKSQDTGIMQLLPSTAKQIFENAGYNYNYQSLFDIDKNIMGGAMFFRDNLNYFSSKNFGQNTIYYSLIAYNRGPGRTYKEYKNNQVVSEYADRVLSIYDKIKLEYTEYRKTILLENPREK